MNLYITGRISCTTFIWAIPRSRYSFRYSWALSLIAELIAEFKQVQYGSHVVLQYGICSMGHSVLFSSVPWPTGPSERHEEWFTSNHQTIPEKLKIATEKVTGGMCPHPQCSRPHSLWWWWAFWEWPAGLGGKRPSGRWQQPSGPSGFAGLPLPWPPSCHRHRSTSASAAARDQRLPGAVHVTCLSLNNQSVSHSFLLCLRQVAEMYEKQLL